MRGLKRPNKQHIRKVVVGDKVQAVASILGEFDG